MVNVVITAEGKNPIEIPIGEFVSTLNRKMGRGISGADMSALRAQVGPQVSSEIKTMLAESIGSAWTTFTADGMRAKVDGAVDGEFIEYLFNRIGAAIAREHTAQMQNALMVSMDSAVQEFTDNNARRA